MKALVIVALLLLSQTAHTQDRVWLQSPEVYVNNTGAPNSGLSEAIEYSVWMYNERMGTNAEYVGFTDYVEDGPIGSIVYNWLDPLSFAIKFDSFNIKGVTQSYTFKGTDNIAKVVVWLNALYFGPVMDACGGLVVTHELLHSMGSRGHNDYAHSLMYATPSHCRYIPLQEDLPLSPSCYAEVSPVYDVYIPNILGKQVFLKNEGNNLWSVDWASEGSGVRCSTYTIDGDTVTLHDVRSMHGNYRVTLKQYGELWQLIEATQ